MTEQYICTASSWRGGVTKPYGPGGFNRCTLPLAHVAEKHVDQWGNVFVLEPKFRVVGRREATE